MTMPAFNFDALIDSFPMLLQGLGNTVWVSILGVAGSLLIGLFFGSARAYKIPVLRQIGTVYVALFRGTPILVQIFFLYYALPEFGVRLSVGQVAILALALYGGSYNTENFRAAFLAVSSGVLQAAAAIGMRGHQRFIWIALPLALRIVLPSCINTSISVLKDSAYLSVIAFAELTYVSMNIVANDFLIFEMFAVLAITYLGLVLLLSFAMNSARIALERRGTVGDI